jgi:hypothetical protein
LCSTKRCSALCGRLSGALLICLRREKSRSC